VNVNFQFLQKTHFKSPRSRTDRLFIESYFNRICSDKTLNYDYAKLSH